MSLSSGGLNKSEKNKNHVENNEKVKNEKKKKKNVDHKEKVKIQKKK